MAWNHEPTPPAVERFVDRLKEWGKRPANLSADHARAIKRTAKRVAFAGLFGIVAVCAAVGAAIYVYGDWHHTRKEHMIAAHRCAMHDDCAIWTVEAACERGWFVRTKTVETFEERGRTAAGAAQAFAPWEPSCQVLAISHARLLKNASFADRAK